jgi:polyferredoxin/formate hydrogenlyase subunit 6/NADH:ubiquinone oxidoreductase subunit I
LKGHDLSTLFVRNKDNSPWYARVLRITTVRIVSQALFFSLFMFLLWVTWFSRLGGYPVSLFLEVDPLVGIATALSTHTVYRWLWRGMFVLVPTLLLGRVFCNWMCPYGTLHQFVGWLFNIRSNKNNMNANRYRPIFQIKYYILTLFLVLAAFGSLQIGLLDPICLLVRTMTTTVAPASDLVAESTARVLDDKGLNGGVVSFISSAPGASEQRIFSGAWFIGLLIIGLVGMNLVIPRFFCRVLCPLGALLGVLSRFSLFRIDRDLTKCTDCDLCLKHCEGASDPQSALRKSECFVCFNCIDDCPENALSFRMAPVPVKDRIVGSIREGTAKLFGRPLISKRPDTEIKAPDVPRRRWLFAAMAGVLAYPFLRLSAAVNKRGFNEKAIRPPGSVEESEFLERCIKCDQCINVCPTNVLQPSTLKQGGFEGLWTPVMDFSIGFCQYNCSLCSEVCPTGAIQKISVEQKLGIGEFKEQGPIRLGTAFYDRGRCLPWAMETPCVVCEEVCPVSPKAIGTYDEEITRWDGTKVTLNKPYIRPELCIGCGICERECPVVDDAAVYVTAVGETRSKDRTLLLESYKDS